MRQLTILISIHHPLMSCVSWLEVQLMGGGRGGRERREGEEGRIGEKEEKGKEGEKKR